ncbi:MAG: hypothetical protein EOP72_00015 [Variovorax sp.]|nr:MAG: hypothetical protein EOP72_00015 [Variovorax sp.]
MKTDCVTPVGKRPRLHARTQVLLVAVWLSLVVALLARHVMWRDEVRALSLALQGEGLNGMLRGLHGEGHPALWYLLLRGAGTVLPPTAVLPVVSIAVALAAMVLLVRYSPFGLVLIGMLMLGRPALYEYSVMARNYGISMLLMFAFAALYERHRDRGVALGVLLLLLANCNVHSAILSGALCLFWLLDLHWRKAGLRAGAQRNFWVNAALAVSGVALCAATIYPPFNDAARVDASGWSLAALAKALLLPSMGFPKLSGYPLWEAVLKSMSLLHAPHVLAMHVAMSLLLVGSVLGLAARPAAAIAGGVALLGLSVFFSLIYGGDYRHQALWLVFLVSLYWIVGGSAPASHPSWVQTGVSRVGFICFCLLLVLQVALGASRVAAMTNVQAPESRSRDLVRLVASRPELRDAVIVADPDYLAESVAHYLTNRIYLLREQRFGNVVMFTRNARLTLGLDEVLADARRLRAETQHPVIILLAHRLDATAPATTVTEGYNWTFSTTPGQVAEFLSATRRLASFGPVCCTDETFDVHLLDR